MRVMTPCRIVLASLAFAGLVAGCSSSSPGPHFPEATNRADIYSATAVADAAKCDGTAEAIGEYIPAYDELADDAARCTFGPKGNATQIIWVETSNCQIGEGKYGGQNTDSILHDLRDSIAHPKYIPPMHVVRIVGHLLFVEYYYLGSRPSDVDKVAKNVGGKVVAGSTVPSQPDDC